jgi:hypothetical protein
MSVDTAPLMSDPVAPVSAKDVTRGERVVAGRVARPLRRAGAGAAGAHAAAVTASGEGSGRTLEAEDREDARLRARRTRPQA